MRRGGVRANIWTVASLAVIGVAAAMSVKTAAADTLEWALLQAYQNNPSLNAQRAALRATDENVPEALSGYRPKLSITADGGDNYTSAVGHTYTPTGSVGGFSTVNTPFVSRGVGATATQTLYNGFQTANHVR